MECFTGVALHQTKWGQYISFPSEDGGYGMGGSVRARARKEGVLGIASETSILFFRLCMPKEKIEWKFVFLCHVPVLISINYSDPDNWFVLQFLLQ